MTQAQNDEISKDNWYFTSNPQTKSKPNEIIFDLDDKRYMFKTDSGVFSRNQVDSASRLLIKTVPPLQGKILDFGCGYGVIGICLAIKNPKSYFELVDINIRAVGLAAENIIKNNCTNAVAYESDGFKSITGCYDAIVTNPPIHLGKDFLRSLFSVCNEILVKRGSFYAVFHKHQGAKSAIAALKDIFGNCGVIEKSNGIWVLCTAKILP